HFSRKPISIAWYLIAVGSLLLNYFGQSAWLLDNSTSSANPFFALVPQAYMVPMVILATLASIIASQAVISGMFSIANQAIRQGYLPRLKIVQTSEAVRGQIYIPLVNSMLLIGAVLLTIGFQSSAALASSYGFAVSATRLLTTLAFTLVVLLVWKWSALKVVAFVFFALPLDLMFMAATVTKLPSGHYITLIVTVSVAWAMFAWYIGNHFLTERAQRIDIPIGDFSEVAGLRTDLHRQNRPAIFFQHLPFPPDVRVTPFALLQHVQVTSMLYQPTVIVEFLSSSLPRVAVNDRISFYEYPHGITLVHLTFGFWEPWSMEPVVQLGLDRGWWAKEEEIVYYAAREDLRFSKGNGLPLSVKLPYAFLHRFDQRILRMVKLDRARCVELGAVVEI
ncbi:MAG: KUP/HAK/KT family potassium transporter, partial [Hyphomicrobium sp.]